jgi:hypothetical protein
MPDASPGTHVTRIFNEVSSFTRKRLTAPSVCNSVFQFPSGIVFPLDESVRVLNELVGFEMHGYLTPN